MTDTTGVPEDPCRHRGRGNHGEIPSPLTSFTRRPRQSPRPGFARGTLVLQRHVEVLRRGVRGLGKAAQQRGAGYRGEDWLRGAPCCGCLSRRECRGRGRLTALAGFGVFDVRHRLRAQGPDGDPQLWGEQGTARSATRETVPLRDRLAGPRGAGLAAEVASALSGPGLSLGRGASTPCSAVTGHPALSLCGFHFVAILFEGHKVEHKRTSVRKFEVNPVFTL